MIYNCNPSGWSSRIAVVHMLKSDIEVTEPEHQSRYHFFFQSNTQGEIMIPLISLAIC